jgi:hypothetical protein
LRWIKNDVLTRRIPVMVLGANCTSDRVDSCYHSGCSCFFAKPADLAGVMGVFRCVWQFVAVVQTPSTAPALAFTQRRNHGA